MTRRTFIALLGGVAAWPLMARAQGGRVRRIGVLITLRDGEPIGRRITAIFEQRLAELGWTIGGNLVIDYRWGVSDLERAHTAVRQVLHLSPDVILVNGGSALTAAQQATRKVPIVFAAISEPVESGFVASLAAPGGNTTGFTNLETTMGGKWLELLKEIEPRVTRVTAMFNPASSFAVRFVASAQAAAQKLAVEVFASHVLNSAEIDAALTALGRETDPALMLPPDGFMPTYRRQIIDLAARHRLPMISAFRSFVADGGLMSYGPDLLDQHRRAATYVDRILRGDKPTDLAVQAPIRYELVINLKTAKTLGLEIPPILLATADEVIE
jgi:putative ABC transport system substrate-binding protein